MLVETDYGTEYGNCINADTLLWLKRREQCETGFLQRELAGQAFLATFKRDVSASLNSQEVVLTAAKLLYNYFHYDLAVFSLPNDSGVVTAYSPLDAAGRMSGFLTARENFPGLKLREINGYRQLGLATPGQARVPGDYPAVVEIAGDGMKITLYCDEEDVEKATHDLLTGIAESLTTALRSAREHGSVKELTVRDSLTGLYNHRDDLKPEVEVLESSQAFYSGNTAKAVQLPDPRVNVRFAVYYGEGQGRIMSDYSVNMSYGGIFIESETILPPSTTLFVEFKLPVNNRQIRCRSQVAWTNEPENPKSPAFPAGMGLQFIDLSLDDVHVIRKYIDEVGLRPTW
jgi:uncharacterized protein (TIGR02266 family)